MGLLDKLFGRVKKEKPRKIYVIYDGERKEYVLVDGKYIPKEKILHIDVNANKLVYVDYDGKIRVTTIEPIVTQRELVEKKAVFT